jgi:tripartite-type tricarboxylate transporter receptor subunit TctC
MVAASAPGGGIDIISRLTAQPLSVAWGQQVVVDNRAGGGGTIGIDIVAKSDPDGYTLLAVGPGITYVAELHKKLPFDVKRDIAPVAFMASQPFVLVIHPSVPAQSVTELIRFAKSKPEQVRFGSGGVGGASHLATELFRATADVNIVHVPYKGTGPGMTALLGGEIHMLVVGVPTAQPHIAAGKIRALAITGSKRAPSIAEVPTIAEAGLAGAVVDIWVALFAPAKTPRTLIAKINRDVNAVLQTPQVKRSFDAAGAVPMSGDVNEFSRYIAAETAKWAKVIRSAGIRTD